MMVVLRAVLITLFLPTTITHPLIFLHQTTVKANGILITVRLKQEVSANLKANGEPGTTWITGVEKQVQKPLLAILLNLVQAIMAGVEKMQEKMPEHLHLLKILALKP